MKIDFIKKHLEWFLKSFFFAIILIICLISQMIATLNKGLFLIIMTILYFLMNLVIEKNKKKKNEK